MIFLSSALGFPLMTSFAVRVMSMSLILFVTQVTPAPLPYTINPVTGEFTAGQTVTATISGAIPFVPIHVDLLDEDSQALITTSIQLNATNGPEPFNFVVPTTLSASILIVVVEALGVIKSTIGSITAASTAASTSNSRGVTSSTSAASAAYVPGSTTSRFNGTSLSLTSTTSATTTSSTSKSATSTYATRHPSSSSTQAMSNATTTNRGVIIGVTIAAVTVALASSALLFWSRQKRESLSQKIHGDKGTFSISRIFNVNNNTLITPFQGQNEAPPGLEQKRKPITLRHLSLNIANYGSSSLRVIVRNSSRRRQQENRKDDNQAEVLPAERQGQSSKLQKAEPPEHDWEVINQHPITFRHQDSGWRNPVEFQSGRSQRVEGREVIELPPDYSDA